MRLSLPNPVLAREIRQRMRGPRATVVLTLYLVILIVLLKFMGDALVGIGEDIQCFEGGCVPVPRLAVLAGSGLGRPMAHWILFVVFLLVGFIVPVLSAGAIAGERERRTLVPLQVTPMSPLSLLLGKLGSSLAFVVLLVVAAIPVFSAAFWVGGVSIGDLARGVAMLIATAILLACLGLLCSTYLRRPLGATIVALGLSFALVAGTFMVYGAQAAYRGLRSEPGTPNPAVLIANPLVATASVLGGTPQALETVPSPFTVMQTLLISSERDDGFEAVAVLGADDARVAAQRPIRPIPGAPFWVYSLLTFAAICAGSLFLAARRLRTPSRWVR